MRAKSGGTGEHNGIHDVNWFTSIGKDANFHGVPANLLNVTGTEYLMFDSY